MRLRPWTAADEAPVTALLAPDSDPLWAAQGHLLHGADRDGERWRRTLVAREGNRVVAAGTGPQPGASGCCARRWRGR
ncbi:MAG: hypothetical protein QOE23_2205 [Pseudonocardiales bacterium]|jgi:hypothetical protein|nr:hypothetical protein [Pseudonocardiales bacterium]